MLLDALKVAGAFFGFVGALAGIVTLVLEVRRRRGRPIGPFEIGTLPQDAIASAIEHFRAFNETDLARFAQTDPPGFISGVRWRISVPHQPVREYVPPNSEELASTLQALLETYGAVELHGEPGTGKTYSIGRLAEKLHCDRKIFAHVVASAWDPESKPSFVQWMQADIARNYRISPTIVAHLLGTGQLMLLLDELEFGDSNIHGRLMSEISESRDVFGTLRLCYTCHSWQHQSLIESTGTGVSIELLDLDAHASRDFFLRLGASATEAAALSRSELLRSPLVLSLVGTGELAMKGLVRAVEAGDDEVLSIAWQPMIASAADRVEGLTEGDVVRGLRWICGLFDRGIVRGPVLNLDSLTPEWLPDEHARRRARRRLILWFMPGWLGFTAILATFSNYGRWQVALIALASYGLGAIAYFFAHDLAIGPGRRVPEVIDRRGLAWNRARHGSFFADRAQSFVGGALLGAAIGTVVGSAHSLLDSSVSLAGPIVSWALILIVLFAVGRFTGALIATLVAGATLGMISNTLIGLVVGAAMGAAMNTVFSTFEALEVSERPEPGVTDPSHALTRSWLKNGEFEALKWSSIGAAAGLAAWLIERDGWLMFGLVAGLSATFLFALFWSAIPTFNYYSCNRILRTRNVVPMPLAAFLELLVSSRLMTRAGGGYGYRLLHDELRAYLLTVAP
jgi:hypothetical protein